MKTSRLLFLLFLSSITVFGQNSLKELSILEKESNMKKITTPNITSYPGDSSMDIKYYGFDLSLTYSPRQIKGNVMISAVSRMNSLSTFFLNLTNTLIMDSVVQNGQRLNAQHSNNLILVTLNKSYKLNEPFSVKVYYHGTPGTSGFGSFQFSQHSGKEIIWTLSEPYGAPDWWPCKDDPSDKADSMDMIVTAPSFFKVVSNGILISSIPADNGTIKWHWKSRYPIAHYLISLAMTNYSEYVNYFRYSPADSMPVIHYIYPEQLSAGLKNILNRTVTMLEVFSSRYGLYPFIKEKYGHAQFGWGGGMEHQTITSIGAFNEEIISHELAHQWFGDKVTCENWHEIWINEGFATYSTGVYYEDIYGRQEYLNFMRNNMQAAKSARGSIYVADISSVGEIFDYSRSYLKGSAVLHMLRGITGDTLFFRIMKKFANDTAYAYKSVSTQDFRQAAESIYGQNLGYFFDQWIYGENYPRYTVLWDHADSLNGNTYVNLRIQQAQNTNPQFFTMPVQVRITTTVADTVITVFNNQQDQLFSFELKGKFLTHSFDPGEWIMKDVSESVDVQDGIASLEYRLYQNYPNPFNPVTKIRYRIGGLIDMRNQANINSGTKRITLKVYDMLGREAATLVNEDQPSGEYEVEFRPDDFNLSSGIYYYRLEADNQIKTNKMVFLK